MAINIADNMGYNGKKPLDGRTEYATLSAMKAVVDANINEGCLAYNKEDGKYYKFLSTNTVDPDTGKWREFSTGGGGSGLPSGGTQGQYLVKQSATEGDADWQSLNDFTGATASTAGAHGLVPAPSAGDEGKVLFGNGAWGNIVMPSVDYSVLSNEANILSAIEKAIGQSLDGKLLYQKTIDCGAMPANTVKNVAHGISNLGEVVLLRGVCKYDNGSGYTSYPLPKIHDQDINLDIGLAVDATNIYLQGRGNGFPGYTGFVVIQYTKTTDSPLASDEKYAGLLSDGTVVYKKTVATGGSAPSGTTLIYRLALLNSTDVVYFTR